MSTGDRMREIHLAPGIEPLVVGIDFGTLSGRALVVRVADGAELGVAVHEYEHGVLDRQLPSGESLPADWALQDPADWLAVLRHAVPAALADSGADPGAVVAVATDFTACTVLPTDNVGVPLCQTDAGRRRPHAWPKLWKHHAAQPHADRINELAHRRKEPWIGRYGEKLSSEWQFAKALQLLEEDPEIWAATSRWIEAADWIVWKLTGVETRNACTAGYKGVFQDGRYPSREFCAELNSDFADFPATRLSDRLTALGSPAGTLTAEAAALTGLPQGIVVAAGNVDAHVSAAACGAVEPGQLLAVMGTSTCHVLSAPELVEVPGMCGVVDGGIVSGLYGYEAGQSGVGDVFAWFVDTLLPRSHVDAAAAAGQTTHQYLTDRYVDGGAPPPGSHGLLALEWLNGNRSVLVDHHLSGVILGLTLASTPEQIYWSLLEATAFGTQRIIDAFNDSGATVSELILAGGLTANAPLMQLYADVSGYPVSVAASPQAPALGSAIHAAVAAGHYPDIRAAAAAMGRVHRGAYVPDPARHVAYRRLYHEYSRLYDYFGRSEQGGGNEVMHRLRAIRDAAPASLGPLLRDSMDIVR